MPWIDPLEEEEINALSNYLGRVSHIREYPSRNPSLPNLNNIILEHRSSERKIYSLVTTIWRSRKVASDQMLVSTPLDLQQLLGLIVIFNVVLPWNCSKSGRPSM